MELVRGRLVPMNVPAPRHGEICSKVDRILGRFLDDHPLGRPVVNDSGVITERDPDTVRGPDVAYYSYARVPKGPLPGGYLAVVPELIFEVRSPGDRTGQLLARVADLLDAGVTYVCVLDSQRGSATIYSSEEADVVLTGDDVLSFPDILPGFAVPV